MFESITHQTSLAQHVKIYRLTISKAHCTQCLLVELLVALFLPVRI